jgi:uncharacterized membrane-anchored protein
MGSEDQRQPSGIRRLLGYALPHYKSIIAIVLLNAILGIVQERKAEQAAKKKAARARFSTAAKTGPSVISLPGMSPSTCAVPNAAAC